MISRSDEAGPSVQTIFVRRVMESQAGLFEIGQSYDKKPDGFKPSCLS